MNNTRRTNAERPKAIQAHTQTYSQLTKHMSLNSTRDPEYRERTHKDTRIQERPQHGATAPTPATLHCPLIQYMSIK